MSREIKSRLTQIVRLKLTKIVRIVSFILYYESREPIRIIYLCDKKINYLKYLTILFLIRYLNLSR